jgi:hypothetical protein
MLSDENIAELNRQLNRALKDLDLSLTSYSRNRALTRINEIKSLMNELGANDENEVDSSDEILVSLDELFDTVRELFRRCKNRTN